MVLLPFISESNRYQIRPDQPRSGLPILSIHRVEEITVALGLAQLVEQEVDGIHRSHWIENASQHVGLLERIRLDQKLFLTRTRTRDIDRREHPLIRNLAVEYDFRVTRTLELFENHFVHTAAGIDQGRRNNGKRTTIFNITRRTKEALRTL